MAIRIIFSIFVLLFSARDAHAQQSFNVDAEVVYQVMDTGETVVKKNIIIENTSSELYPESYLLNLENLDPYNISVLEEGEPLDYKIEKSKQKRTIKIDFEKPVAGEGKSRNLTITFSEDNLATKTGEVWEITIPKLASDSFRTYQATLLIPESFGEEAFVSPEPLSVEEKDIRSYYFNKNILANSSITAVFGKFQVFAFSLNYHLENPLNKESEVSIALPPDTSLQRVYYSQIEPAPDNVRVDEDGNWLADYKLSRRERLDVTAKGSAQIFANPTALLTPLPGSLIANTKPTQYWQTNNPGIKGLARELKSPENIYNYVVDTLDYDYSRAKPNVQRLGAVGALEQPGSAICMEFTDLFITLARAAGIPAREINGYAYTENPEIQPLSLVSDVLHAWPEYWDEKKGTWVAVDPTWADTTGGTDFFNKLDLRHFAFVIHGQDPTSPFPPGSYKLGKNPQKDVFVNFGELPDKRASDIKINAEKTRTLSPLSQNILITIKNEGNSAAYEIDAQVTMDDAKIASEFIQALPPFAKKELKVTIPYGPMGTKTPDTVLVSANTKTLSIPIEKTTPAIHQLILVSVFIIITLVFVHPKRPKLKSLKNLITGKIAKNEGNKNTKEKTEQKST